MKEGARGWRGLHIEEPHKFYASPSIVRVIKSRRMRWAGHVTLAGRDERCIINISGSLKGRDHSEDLGVDGNGSKETGWEDVWIESG
jgi:hypothetical protein